MSTLLQQIEREDIANQAEWDKRMQLHLPLIDVFCRANDPYELRAQLSGAKGVASLGLENSQGNELPQPFIKCRTGFMEESSRFNYGIDMSIKKRKIDVSGQPLCVLFPLENLLWAKLRDYAISRVNTCSRTIGTWNPRSSEYKPFVRQASTSRLPRLIPNEELRSMSQRDTQIHAYQTTRVFPNKTNIPKLAEELSNTIVDNRFNIKNVSSSARYKITNPGVNYRSLYQTDKNKATYQTPPGDMKPVPCIKTEPDTFP
jgi:hypothetical protein